MNDCNKIRCLMDQLYSVSFALDDVNLFLDTHPDCSAAMQCYDNLRSIEGSLERELRELGFPLKAKNNAGCTCWDWISGPWPWEGEY